MNRIKLWAALGLLLASAFTAQARSLDEVKKDGKINIATEGQFAPFNFFLGSKLSGFEVELAELVAKKMGVTIEWKALGFDALLAGLRQDRWDLVIASHGITEERAKAVTFAEPHYCSGGAIVSLEILARSVANIQQLEQGLIQPGPSTSSRTSERKRVMIRDPYAGAEVGWHDG